MGNPKNYSLELPQRCLTLLEKLLEPARKIRGGDRPDLGPLTSTFILSMSMPIINLPIERIEGRRRNMDAHYASDRPLNKKAALEFDKVLDAKTLSATPFYVPGAWHFITCREEPLPNIARGLPAKVAETLGAEEAAANAANMPARQWCDILRNSLAHGGIAYLDEYGQSSHDSSVKMYAFVSGQYARKQPRPLIAVHILRIGELEYLEFLHHWVAWIRQTGIPAASRAA